MEVANKSSRMGGGLEGKTKLSTDQRRFISNMSRRLGLSKHSVKLNSSRFNQISFTKRNPWTVRDENRAKERRRKQARKNNW